MNANNNPQPPTQAASSASIQIDMMDSGRPATTTTSPTISSTYRSPSFGALRGRLMDGIRRVMLPAVSSNVPVGGAPLRDTSNSYIRFGTSESQVLANRFAPLNSSGGGGVGVSQVVTTTTTTTTTTNSPHTPHTSRQTSYNSQASPRSPVAHDEHFYASIEGGVVIPEEDVTAQHQHQEPRVAGGGGGAGGVHQEEEDNQRNVETFTDAMAQHPELRSFVIAVLKTLPFIGIVVLKVAYDHLDSLINLAFLGGIFFHANLHLKREIGKKQLRSGKKLALLLLLIAFGLLLKLVDDPYILDILTMLSYRTVHTFSELAYYLIMADLCVKCLTVATKMVITLMPERIVEFKGRGRIYLLVEAVSQFYRCFLPVQPWAAFLLNNYEGCDKIFGTLLVVAYVFWKFREVLGAGKFLRDSFIKFKQNSNFGTMPTSDELHAVGNQCPICHESFSCPIALECGHIFCDACIGVWFDRETTCPLCRKKITDDPRYRDGSTSFFVQFA